MFSASISPQLLRDHTLAWGAGLYRDFEADTKSGTVGLARFQVRWPVPKSTELAADWASLSAFAETSLFFTAVDESPFFAFEILKSLSLSSVWMGSNNAPEMPDPSPVIHTISFIQRWQDSRIFPGWDAASLRRLTKPLRGFPRRRLSRGACRPPSIPPASAAFERVHARAGLGSAP